jgi:tetratricopeptide (TPR) repeat protein
MLTQRAEHNQNRPTVAIVAIFIAVLAIAPYLQTLRYGFVEYDDPLYVIHNPHVEHGLNRTSIEWAFTTFRTGNWHPVTWLSHLLDADLWGANAGGHHLTNALLHGGNAVLLFFVLMQMTRSLWRCALVSVLFAVHPLHVESVAWISERKDVLSTFFGLLALWAYVGYARSSSIRRYLLVVVLFILSLMAKTMWVTFPFLLLLLDIWPLQRWKLWPIDSSTSQSLQLKAVVRRRVFLEKVPLLVIAAAFCVVAMLSQREGRAVINLADFPIGARIGNVIVGYTLYLAKLIFPIKLSFLYPLRIHSISSVACSALVLLVVTITTVRYRHRDPALLIGWLWFLGTLIPVIGFVQIGWQTIADRYSYLPSIGIFIMGAWSIPAQLPSLWRRSSITLGSVFLALLIAKTWRQVSYWQDTSTLYLHAVQVTRHNFIVHQLIGHRLERENKFTEALEIYRLAAAETPPYARTTIHENIAGILIREQRNEEALDELNTAIRINPASSPAYNSMGLLMLTAGKDDKAVKYLQRAVELEPINIPARINYGIVLTNLRRWDEAIEQLSPVVRAEPNRFVARTNLAIAFAGRGEFDRALTELREVLRTNPDHTPAIQALHQIEFDKQQSLARGGNGKKTQ